MKRLICIVSAIFTIHLCGCSDYRYRKQGQVLIDCVESFRLQH